MTVFKALGAALLIYWLYALMRGEVYGKSGVWGRTFRRADDAFRYWSVMAVYGLLAAALLCIF